MPGCRARWTAAARFVPALPGCSSATTVSTRTARSGPAESPRGGRPRSATWARRSPVRMARWVSGSRSVTWGRRGRRGERLAISPPPPTQDCRWRHRREPVLLPYLVHCRRELPAPAAGLRLEEVGLCRDAGVGPRPPDQPRARIPRAHAVERLLEERPGALIDLAVQVSAQLQRLAAGDGVEVVVAKLERHGTPDQPLVAKLAGHAGREQEENRRQLLRIPQVAREGGLPAHRLGESLTAQGGAAVPQGSALERARFRPDQPRQRRLLHLLDLPDVGEPKLGPARGRLGADARHRREREPGEKPRLPPCPNLHQPSRL